MDTKILPCVCDSKDQDKRYGKDNRVHNKTVSTKYPPYRCTVCEREK